MGLEVDESYALFDKLSEEEQQDLYELDSDPYSLTRKQKRFFVWGCCYAEVDDPGCIEGQCESDDY